MKFYSLFLLLALATVWGCGDPIKPTPTSHNLIFKIKFDSTQVRLNNLGQPAAIPTGNAAQTPKVNSIAAHYIEMTPTMYTPFGGGEVVYVGKQNTLGGSDAIDFDSLKKVADGDVFYTIPLSEVKAGDYEYLRVSLAYENGDIRFKYVHPSFPTSPFYFTGTLASFVGFNTYIRSFQVKTQTVTVNDDKLQGFWAFEIPATPPYLPSASTQQGNAPTTTVVNPIASTSPIPAGSCVVTGAFANKLTITGNETQDVIVTISLSNNKSFEWQEVNADGFFEPAAGETVTDMGIRGLIPSYTK